MFDKTLVKIIKVLNNSNLILITNILILASLLAYFVLRDLNSPPDFDF
jgi:hypothetical protein